MTIILTAEAASYFDELTRSDKLSQLSNSWPATFRSSELIPAVEYTFERIGCARWRWLTNLTGHPAVVLPDGFTKEGLPTSVTFIGQLYDEGALLAIAKAYQDATGFHLKLPRLD